MFEEEEGVDTGLNTAGMSYDPAQGGMKGPAVALNEGASAAPAATSRFLRNGVTLDRSLPEAVDAGLRYIMRSEGMEAEAPLPRSKPAAPEMGDAGGATGAPPAAAPVEKAIDDGEDEPAPLPDTGLNPAAGPLDTSDGNAPPAPDAPVATNDMALDEHATPPTAKRYLDQMGFNDEEQAIVLQALDPDGSLEDDLKAIASITGTYETMLNAGDTKAAEIYSAKFLYRYRKLSGQLASAAVNEMQRGNLTEAGKLLQRAYDWVPDGNKVDFEMDEQGNGQYVLRNSLGEVVADGPFTVQDMAAMALGLADGQAYWQALMSTGAKAGSGGGGKGGAEAGVDVGDGAPKFPSADAAGADNRGSPDGGEDWPSSFRRVPGAPQWSDGQLASMSSFAERIKQANPGLPPDEVSGLVATVLTDLSAEIRSNGSMLIINGRELPMPKPIWQEMMRLRQDRIDSNRAAMQGGAPAAGAPAEGAPPQGGAAGLASRVGGAVADSVVNNPVTRDDGWAEQNGWDMPDMPDFAKNSDIEPMGDPMGMGIPDVPYAAPGSSPPSQGTPPEMEATGNPMGDVGGSEMAIDPMREPAPTHDEKAGGSADGVTGNPMGDVGGGEGVPERAPMPLTNGGIRTKDDAVKPAPNRMAGGRRNEPVTESRSKDDSRLGLPGRNATRTDAEHDVEAMRAQSKAVGKASQNTSRATTGSKDDDAFGRRKHQDAARGPTDRPSNPSDRAKSVGELRRMRKVLKADLAKAEQAGDNTLVRSLRKQIGVIDTKLRGSTALGG